jgi:hypothetical protein
MSHTIPSSLVPYGSSHAQWCEPDPEPKQQESQLFVLAEPEP